MFWICSSPAPPELIPGSMVFTIFAASGKRSVVFFATAPGLGLADPVVDGVHAASTSSTRTDSALIFLIRRSLRESPPPNVGEGYDRGAERYPRDRLNSHLMTQHRG